MRREQPGRGTWSTRLLAGEFQRRLMFLMGATLLVFVLVKVL
jgi:hypothetical protein